MMKEYLSVEVGKDGRQDLIYSGYIQAVRDFLLANLVDVEETQ